jgi:hypothetical protein
MSEHDTEQCKMFIMWSEFIQKWTVRSYKDGELLGTFDTMQQASDFERHYYDK